MIRNCAFPGSFFFGGGKITMAIDDYFLRSKNGSWDWLALMPAGGRQRDHGYSEGKRDTNEWHNDEGDRRREYRGKGEGGQRRLRWIASVAPAYFFCKRDDCCER